MTAMAISRILLLDANAPWVRSLFAAMRPVQTHALVVHVGPKILKRRRWQRAPDEICDSTLTVPGWTKFPKVSAFILRAALKSAIRRMGGAELIVYTLPVYAEIAESFRDTTCQVYHAHDVFRFYDWNLARTMELERRMVQACDATFAVAQALAEDFRKITARPVFHCPMAVSTAFVETLATDGGSVAAELSALRRPIVGCIGQINRGYDWPLIGALADGLPQATFVFVGPIFEESPDVRRPMEEVFNRPNVKCLGKKPHDQLPGYLRGFDVCLNPLAITEHNDRRSPLRLYDYLATDKPVLSTAIREAFSHEGLVETFKTAAEAVELIRRVTSPGYRVDLAARSRYIRNNTWSARAQGFLRDLESLRAAGGR
jgi:glycosyltransferase involved in cell wall biosynthesis